MIVLSGILVCIKLNNSSQIMNDAEIKGNINKYNSFLLVLSLKELWVWTFEQIQSLGVQGKHLKIQTHIRLVKASNSIQLVTKLIMYWHVVKKPMF